MGKQQQDKKFTKALEGRHTGFLYIYIYSQEQLFYLKTFLKHTAYTAGFGSRDKILRDPALFCFSHPNIHIVITEK